MDSPPTNPLRVRELFEAALDRPLRDRSAFLGEACAGDTALHARVQELLSHAARAAGFMSQPATALDGDFEPGADRWVGREVDGYRIRSLLAHGGMGIVFEAEQLVPRRTVALKLLRRGYRSEDARRRFRLEVEVLGLLKHPGIAQIHGAGTVDDEGQQLPYIAMELVENALPLPRFAVERDLQEAERLALFRDVCEAVEHGHRKGIVHRDLKPGNVLADGNGAVKVIDFGLARVTAPGVVRVSLVETRQGGLLGTLEYMSPEHVTGVPLDVDVRSDVYSLGCILLELLTDRPPRNFAQLPIAAAVQRLQSEDPVLPPALPRELRWILIRALERSPERRYSSALALSDDLGRYLCHESVHAVQPSAFYQLSKFGRRHRTLLAAGTAVVLALTIGLVRADREAVRAKQAESLALRQWTVAHNVGEFLSDLFRSSHAYRKGGDAKVVDMVHDAASKLEHVEDPGARAILGSLIGEGLLNLDELDRAEALLEPAWASMQADFPVTDRDRLHAGAVWADLLEQRGDHERALALTLELLAQAESVLGPEHPDTFYLRQNLAVLHQRKGREVDAEAVLRDTLATERAAENGSENQVNVLHKLGQSLSDQGRLSEAVTVYEEAAGLAEGLVDTGTLYSTVIRMDLALAVQRLGELAEAERLLRDCLLEFERNGGTTSNRFAVRTNLIGVLVQRADSGVSVDLDEIDGWLEDTGELLGVVEREPGRFQLAWLSAEAARQRLEGNFEASAEAALACIELTERLFPEFNPGAVPLYVSLAAALEQDGNVEGALDVMAEVTGLLEGSVGAGSGPWRELVRNHLKLLRRAGLITEARMLAEELVARTPEGADDLETNRTYLEYLPAPERTELED